MPDLLVRLRLEIYRHWTESSRAPLAGELATALGEDIDLALDQLAAAHAIVLEKDTKQIRRMHPFSGVPTPYAVRSRGISYWANCAWDSLGIAAMLGRDTGALAVCAASGAPAGRGCGCRCLSTRSRRGASMSLEQCWHLSQLWYPPRLQADWQRKNAQETQALFAQVGLSGEFWRLNPR